MNLTTTTPSLVHALRRSNNWRLIRYGRQKDTMKRFEANFNLQKKQLCKSQSNRRITYSFNYKK